MSEQSAGAYDDYLVGRLRALDPAVRADVLRVLDGVVRELPRVWRRGTGVPQFLVHLDGPEEVRVERLGLRELCEQNGYPDEFSRWIGGVPVRKAAECGCAAVVYGNCVHSRFYRIGPFGSPRFAPDTFAVVAVSHRDAGVLPRADVHFDIEGRLFPRMVVRRRLPDVLARVRGAG